MVVFTKWAPRNLACLHLCEIPSEECRLWGTVGRRGHTVGSGWRLSNSRVMLIAPLVIHRGSRQQKHQNSWSGLGSPAGVHHGPLKSPLSPALGSGASWRGEAGACAHFSQPHTLNSHRASSIEGLVFVLTVKAYQTHPKMYLIQFILDALKQHNIAPKSVVF